MLRVTSKLLAWSALAALLWGSPAWSEQGAESAVIEEIIVTGTKRELSSQDVPISLTAISEQQLAKQFRQDILAIGELTPSVAFGRVPSFRAITGGIRGTGQNAILVTQDLSVAILVDEFGLSHVQSQWVELFDIERIEVYRGPQGTLFGKSATGGAISMITKRPVMNEYSADVSLRWGQHAGGDSSASGNLTKIEAAVNIPLIEDTLALRAVALLDHDQGAFTDDKSTGDPDNRLIGVMGGPLPPELDSIPLSGNGKKINGVDVFSSKIKLLWTPTDNYEAYFMWTHTDDDSDTPQSVNESTQTQLATLLGFPGIGLTGGDVYQTARGTDCFGEAFCIPSNGKINSDLIQLHQSLTTGPLTWKLLLGRFEMDEIQPNSFLGEGYPFINGSRNTKREENQIELRVASDFDGPLNFVAGFAWSDAEVDLSTYSSSQFQSLLSLRDPAIMFNPDGTLALNSVVVTDPSASGAAQDRDTIALYADATFEVTERLRFTAGVRYTDDEKEFFRRTQSGGPCTALTPVLDEVIVNGECLDSRSTALSRVGGGFEPADADPFNLPLPDSAFGIAATAKESWDEVTYRFVVNYDVNDSAMVYASYATGFIPGGFTETCSAVETCIPFDSETNKNFEVGFKGDFLDNTLRVNGAVFFTEYEDIVRAQVLPFTDAFGRPGQQTVNINAGVSDLFGVETEVTWQATPNLRLDLFVGYLDHEYDEFELTGVADFCETGAMPGDPVDLSCLNVPFTPEWKFGASATYEHPFLGGSLEWNTSFAHTDESETSVFNSENSQHMERDLWDANVTYYSPDERWRVAAYVKNITDDRYRIAGNSIGALWVNTFWGNPRQFGFEFSASL